MFELLQESKAARTGVFALVAGTVALLSFLLLGAVGIGGALKQFLAVGLGLGAGLVLEGLVPPPEPASEPEDD